MMRERFRRSFREDALSASVAVMLLLFGGLSLYGEATVDGRPFAWILLAFGALNTAAVLATLLSSPRTRGAVAWAWGLLHVILVFVMFTARIFLAPAVLDADRRPIGVAGAGGGRGGVAGVGSVGRGIVLFAGVL